MTEDLSVFFNTAEFAHVCTLQRSGEPDVPFNAIFGVVDQTALQGYAITAEYELSYPTNAVQLLEGDNVLIDGQVWRVRRDPMRVADGRISSAFLSSTQS